MVYETLLNIYKIYFIKFSFLYYLYCIINFILNFSFFFVKFCIIIFVYVLCIRYREKIILVKIKLTHSERESDHSEKTLPKMRSVAYCCVYVTENYIETNIQWERSFPTKHIDYVIPSKHRKHYQCFTQTVIRWDVSIFFFFQSAWCICILHKLLTSQIQWIFLKTEPKFFSNEIEVFSSIFFNFINAIMLESSPKLRKNEILERIAANKSINLCWSKREMCGFRITVLPTLKLSFLN